MQTHLSWMLQFALLLAQPIPSSGHRIHYMSQPGITFQNQIRIQGYKEKMHMQTFYDQPSYYLATSCIYIG